MLAEFCIPRYNFDQLVTSLSDWNLLSALLSFHSICCLPQIQRLMFSSLSLCQQSSHFYPHHPTTRVCVCARAHAHTHLLTHGPATPSRTILPPRNSIKCSSDKGMSGPPQADSACYIWTHPSTHPHQSTLLPLNSPAPKHTCSQTHHFSPPLSQSVPSAWDCLFSSCSIRLPNSDQILILSCQQRFPSLCSPILQEPFSKSVLYTSYNVY